MEGQFSDAEDDPTPIDDKIRTEVVGYPDNLENMKNLKIDDRRKEMVAAVVENDDSNADDVEEDSDFDDFEEDDYYDSDFEEGNFGKAHPNRQGQGQGSVAACPSKVSKFQPSEKLFKKFTGKINVEKFDAGPGKNVSSSAMNAVIQQKRREDKDLFRNRDKADRATVEQVSVSSVIFFHPLKRWLIHWAETY